MVLGGARPPPQSRNEQISPLPGSYQIRDAPPYTTVSDDTQPSRSVLARAVGRRQRAVRRTLTGAWEVSMVVIVLVGVGYDGG